MLLNERTRQDYSQNEQEDGRKHRGRPEFVNENQKGFAMGDCRLQSSLDKAGSRSIRADEGVPSAPFQ